jgi:probable F420-dependent oxidoreductase
VELGVSLHPLWSADPGTGERVTRAAREAERLGLHHVRVGSHILKGRLSQESQDLDPVVLLSAVAAATSHLRLVAAVLVLPLYDPVFLANQAASLDVISDGRFVLGAGVGWDLDEFAAVGVPFAERGARTDEYLQVMRSLWTHRYVDYAGRFTSLRHAGLAVDPATPGGPPVWVGGHSDHGIRRALRFAQAWHGSGVDAAGLEEVGTRIARFADEFGRDPATLALTSGNFLVPPGMTATEQPPGRLVGGAKPTTASILDELGRLGELGLSVCSLWMPISSAAMPDAIAWIAAELLPELG